MNQYSSYQNSFLPIVERFLICAVGQSFHRQCIAPVSDHIAFQELDGYTVPISITDQVVIDRIVDSNQRIAGNHLFDRAVIIQLILSPE